MTRRMINRKTIVGVAISGLLGLGAAVPAVAQNASESGDGVSVVAARDAEAITLENGVLKVGKRYHYVKKCYVNQYDVKKCRWVKTEALRWKPKPTSTSTATTSPTATSSWLLLLWGLGKWWQSWWKTATPTSLPKET